MLRPKTNLTRKVVDLTGLWQFQIDPGSSGEGSAWYRELPSPRMVAVPGSWNEQFTETDKYLGRAWYLTRVEVPLPWRGQEIFLWVGSANYAARAWVNGAMVGSHEGGNLPFEFAITEQIDWEGGLTTIAIEVENELRQERVPPGGPESDGNADTMKFQPPTRYDYFPYAGINRPVLLYTAPPVHLADLTVVTDRDGVDGLVHVSARVARDWSGRGRIALETADGAPLTADLTVVAGAGDATLRVPNARFWRPADPVLYPLTVTLYDGDRTLDTYSLRIGIRTVAVQGDRLLLNGEPIYLRGFGKHEDFPVNGRGLNLPVMVRDYSLLNWIGANSYRTSHYPVDEDALELADREGILVIDEAPGVGLTFDDGDENVSRRQSQLLREVEEMIARDKNHPSVIIWSVANEPIPNKMNANGTPSPAVVESGGDPTGGNAFFTAVTDRARALDPTRPVTIVLAQDQSPDSWLALSDVVCINRFYGWDVLGGRLPDARQALGAELDALHDALGKPLIITEFGADTIAGLHRQPAEMFSEEYQVEVMSFHLDVADERPYVAGLHVWTFADFRTSQSTRRAGGMNLKGVFTRDREPKLAAFFLRERWNQ